MRLGGLQKMTLLDFPGRVACTVFTVGCNFRCPFCHNTALVLPGGKAASAAPQNDTTSGGRQIAVPTEESSAATRNEGMPEYPLEDFFRFLEKRRGLLDGVAITGGEPLLHPDIDEFIRRIRSLGYAVKLDTNGSFPDRLLALIDEGLLDYVAVDIKHAYTKYAKATGVYGYSAKMEKTLALLRMGRVEYEFRTTLVDELHEPEDFTVIGQWLYGTKNYFIQQFVDSGDILGGENRYHAASPEKTQACLEAVRKYLPNAQLRGQ